ncbi:Arc family DNA-binding protein [Xenorhabdus sp. Flor]|uniref:Arc family DNA-binding protein n=1 Tax=Xenorhabdus cabanillasii TaxID=351673 RepID=UPI0019BE9B53|nr:Arc family DNA-binding protein [Xenorhabdus sp. Flor]MBD2816566.1 Arc family DNA-binding protein [Xenorhabdus sp. Flor]
MSKKDVQLNIRITQELKERIEESAKANNRSINAETITLINKALESRNAIEGKAAPFTTELDIPDCLSDEEAVVQISKEVKRAMKDYVNERILKMEEEITASVIEYTKNKKKTNKKAP